MSIKRYDSQSELLETFIAEIKDLGLESDNIGIDASTIQWLVSINLLKPDDRVLSAYGGPAGVAVAVVRNDEEGEPQFLRLVKAPEPAVKPAPRAD